MLCPNCNIVMRMAVREGVEIDYCPGCRGIWLDKGELDKLMDRAAEAARSAALMRPSAPPPPQLPPGQTRPQEDYDFDDQMSRSPRYERERRRDDDRGNEWRYDERRRDGRKRKRSFLEDIFDIFD